MIRNLVQFESTIDGRVGRWYIDNDCPLNIAKEMLFQFQKHLGQIEDSVKEQQAAIEEKKKADELAALPKTDLVETPKQE
jgi:hypothetical protein